jgi:hypothetical protein
MLTHRRTVAVVTSVRTKRGLAVQLALTLCAAGMMACTASTSAGPSGTGGQSAGSGGSATAGSGGGGSPTGSGGSSAGGTTGSSSGGTPGGGGGSSANGGTGASSADGGSTPPPVTDGGTTAGDGGQDLFPLMKVLPLFTAPDVPVRGPSESPPTSRNWTSPATLPTRIGNGIAQHPMLYVGENYNRISLVNAGKVIWTYDTVPGFELDDVWMLSNGNILYSHMTFIEEITPNKQVVWHYAPTSGEIHTCQPLGLDKVLFVENALPMARVRIYNLTTKTYEVDHMIAAGTTQHGQFRRFRMTGAGTYLASFLSLGKVVEFDKSFNILWTYLSPQPWSAVRLKNGNTLIQDERDSTAKEVNAQGQIVWQLAKTDFTLPAGAGMGNTQSCERLSSGNTVMFGNGGTNVNNIQAVEVTPAKQVVWMLQDWIHLGDATSAQFLDEPGYPEVPGATNH